MLCRDPNQPISYRSSAEVYALPRSSEGVASTGALRAAELAPYGMRGVGAVFAAYRD